MRPGAGLYIYIAGTGSCVHEPIHHIFRSFVGQHRKMGCCPPAQYRSFTSIQMVHTHAPPQQGRWNENESEMTMKMKWNLLNQNAKRGAQKKRDRENTNTTHLARNGQTLERQEKRKKSGGRRTTEQDQRRGGKDGSAWTNLTRRKPTPTLAREGPNLPEEGRTQEHMRKGTRGGLVDEDASTWTCRFPLLGSTAQIRVNPMDGLSCQPLNYVHNWTSPTTKKEKSTIPASMSFCLIMWACLTCGLSLEQHSKRKLLSWLPAMQRLQVAEESRGQAQRHTVQHSFDRRVRHEKWPAVALYLNELLIQKCKFRHQVVASTLCLDKHSPKGSCHLDESSMNHTLAQNSHCEFWCDMHRTCKKHSN